LKTRKIEGNDIGELFSIHALAAVRVKTINVETTPRRITGHNQ
jgi:hypothetical protein